LEHKSFPHKNILYKYPLAVHEYSAIGQRRQEDGAGMTKQARCSKVASMTVLRAKVHGMCMGVRRAELNARQAAAEGGSTDRAVYTYGPLIHNPQAVAELKKSGVDVLNVDEFESGRLDGMIAGSIVIIRAHGAPPEVFGHLEKAGAKVIDATCPRVRKSQRKARELLDQGYSLAIAGERAHGEVAGILGYAPGAVVVENPAEAGELAGQWAERKVALIAQTTIKQSEYDAIAAQFAARCREFLPVNTLCPSTADRQRSLAELAEKVDALVIVGGKNSANTQRLYMAARETGKPAWHIETAAELPGEVCFYGRVGLSAGASTPDSLVDEVEARILECAP
jgi:4-hydroxy-3-methylbut-2-enyl diphosphate reductase